MSVKRIHILTTRAWAVMALVAVAASCCLGDGDSPLVDFGKPGARAVFKTGKGGGAGSVQPVEGGLRVVFTNVTDAVVRFPAVKKAGAVADWMATATDIRGEGYPRLRDGKVNIGCYQCWLDPLGMVLLLR